MEEDPERVYHFGVSAIFALLGMLMARMIVFWSPYIMIMASVFLADKDIWSCLVQRLGRRIGLTAFHLDSLILGLRHLILLLTIAGLYLSHKETIHAQLVELREFWDPDTVDLMQWIKQHTAESAAFAGTMQLMAGNNKT